MQRLEVLAKAAVGFDSKRGDEVAMENVSFTSNAPELAPAGLDKLLEEGKGLMQSQSGLLRSGVVGVLGVLVIWLVLKPVAAQVVSTLKEPLRLESGLQIALPGYAPEPVGALGPAVREAVSREAVEAPRRLGDKRGQVFDQVAEHVRKEPTESTRLLAAWIGSEEEEA